LLKKVKVLVGGSSQACSRAKATSQPAVAPATFPLPHRRFQHVHVDLAGPFPSSSEGFSYLLTMVDRTTRWLEAAPLRSMAADACVQAFLSTWVARFGVPAVITSDQGAQFTSAHWEALTTALGCQHITTSAFHPQSNGMVERSHRQLKDALLAILAGTQWLQHLPWVLLGLRVAPKEESCVSSAELVVGEFLAAGEKAPEVFTSLLNQRPPLPTRRATYAEAACKPSAALLAAPLVYVRRGSILPPLEPHYAGPFRVVSTCFIFYTNCPEANFSKRSSF
jgi:Integrase core domain